MGNDLHLQVREIGERVAFPGLREIDQPDGSARSGEDVLEVKISMQDGLGALDPFRQARVQCGERVGQSA